MTIALILLISFLIESARAVTTLKEAQLPLVTPASIILKFSHDVYLPNCHSKCLGSTAKCDIQICSCPLGTVDTIRTEDICDYSQKSALLAILFEIMLPAGMGNVYLGNFYYANFKIFIFVICPLFLWIYLSDQTACSQKQFFYENREIVGKFFFSSAFLWLLIDVVYFVTMEMTDGFGIPLKL